MSAVNRILNFYMHICRPSNPTSAVKAKFTIHTYSYKTPRNCWKGRPLRTLLLTVAAAGVSTCKSASNAIHHA
jgi:hypothetical protein